MKIKFKGGPGSGNYGHAGRPGIIGGSGGTSAGSGAAIQQHVNNAKSKLERAGMLDDKWMGDTTKRLDRHMAKMSKHINGLSPSAKADYGKELEATANRILTGKVADFDSAVRSTSYRKAFGGWSDEQRKYFYGGTVFPLLQTQADLELAKSIQ